MKLSRAKIARLLKQGKNQSRKNKRANRYKDKYKLDTENSLLNEQDLIILNRKRGIRQHSMNRHRQTNLRMKTLKKRQRGGKAIDKPEKIVKIQLIIRYNQQNLIAEIDLRGFNPSKIFNEVTFNDFYTWITEIGFTNVTVVKFFDTRSPTSSPHAPAPVVVPSLSNNTILSYFLSDSGAGKDLFFVLNPTKDIITIGVWIPSSAIYSKSVKPMDNIAIKKNTLGIPVTTPVATSVTTSTTASPLLTSTPPAAPLSTTPPAAPVVSTVTTSTTPAATPVAINASTQAVSNFFKKILYEDYFYLIDLNRIAGLVSYLKTKQIDWIPNIVNKPSKKQPIRDPYIWNELSAKLDIINRPINDNDLSLADYPCSGPITADYNTKPFNFPDEADEKGDEEGEEEGDEENPAPVKKMRQPSLKPAFPQLPETLPSLNPLPHLQPKLKKSITFVDPSVATASDQPIRFTALPIPSTAQSSVAIVKPIPPPPSTAQSSVKPIPTPPPPLRQYVRGTGIPINPKITENDGGGIDTTAPVIEGGTDILGFQKRAKDKKDKEAQAAQAAQAHAQAQAQEKVQTASIPVRTKAQELLSEVINDNSKELNNTETLQVKYVLNYVIANHMEAKPQDKATSDFFKSKNMLKKLDYYFQKHMSLLDFKNSFQIMPGEIYANTPYTRVFLANLLAKYKMKVLTASDVTQETSERYIVLIKDLVEAFVKNTKELSLTGDTATETSAAESSATELFATVPAQIEINKLFYNLDIITRHGNYVESQIITIEQALNMFRNCNPVVSDSFESILSLFTSFNQYLNGINPIEFLNTLSESDYNTGVLRSFMNNNKNIIKSLIGWVTFNVLPLAQIYDKLVLLRHVDKILKLLEKEGNKDNILEEFGLLQSKLESNKALSGQIDTIGKLIEAYVNPGTSEPSESSNTTQEATSDANTVTSSVATPEVISVTSSDENLDPTLGTSSGENLGATSVTSSGASQVGGGPPETELIEALTELRTAIETKVDAPSESVQAVNVPALNAPSTINAPALIPLPVANTNNKPFVSLPSAIDPTIINSLNSKIAELEKKQAGLEAKQNDAKAAAESAVTVSSIFTNPDYFKRTNYRFNVTLPPNVSVDGKGSLEDNLRFAVNKPGTGDGTGTGNNPGSGTNPGSGDGKGSSKADVDFQALFVVLTNTLQKLNEKLEKPTADTALILPQITAAIKEALTKVNDKELSDDNKSKLEKLTDIQQKANTNNTNETSKGINALQSSIAAATDFDTKFKILKDALTTAKEALSASVVEKKEEKSGTASAEKKEEKAETAVEKKEVKPETEIYADIKAACNLFITEFKQTTVAATTVPSTSDTTTVAATTPTPTPTTPTPASSLTTEQTAIIAKVEALLQLVDTAPAQTSAPPPAQANAETSAPPPAQANAETSAQASAQTSAIPEKTAVIAAIDKIIETPSEAATATGQDQPNDEFNKKFETLKTALETAKEALNKPAEAAEGTPAEAAAAAAAPAENQTTIYTNIVGACTTFLTGMPTTETPAENATKDKPELSSEAKATATTATTATTEAASKATPETSPTPKEKNNHQPTIKLVRALKQMCENNTTAQTDVLNAIEAVLTSYKPETAEETETPLSTVDVELIGNLVEVLFEVKSELEQNPDAEITQTNKTTINTACTAFLEGAKKAASTTSEASAPSEASNTPEASNTSGANTPPEASAPSEASNTSLTSTTTLTSANTPDTSTTPEVSATKSATTVSSIPSEMVASVTELQTLAESTPTPTVTQVIAAIKKVTSAPMSHTESTPESAAKSTPESAAVSKSKSSSSKNPNPLSVAFTGMFGRIPSMLKDNRRKQLEEILETFNKFPSRIQPTEKKRVITIKDLTLSAIGDPDFKLDKAEQEKFVDLFHKQFSNSTGTKKGGGGKKTRRRQHKKSKHHRKTHRKKSLKKST